jgi:hypothetical protein
VRDQVLQPYSTTSKIKFLYILIFRFFIWYRKTIDFGVNNSKHSLNFNLLLFSSCFKEQQQKKV